jgi:glycosyltransferase involved in cell wall biosynthesis
LRVAHLVDAMGGNRHLWGKERVVALLMREQRDCGTVAPALITFSPGLLTERLEREGFPVAALSSGPSHGIAGTIGRLAEVLSRTPADVIHSHGYRANIVARALRLSGRARGVRIVSTCHGWVVSTSKLRFYNTMDRWTSMLSDVITVPDARMLASLPPVARRRHVPNAVPELEIDGDAEAFERPGEFVVGTLGRISDEKGIPELLSAARAFPDPGVMFVLAGDGERTDDVRKAGSNVMYAGYFTRPERYLAALDVYAQVSRSEGLSLALLEAMRAGKPIVATAVGATGDAVTHGESALLIPPLRADALRDAILTLRADPALAARLGRNARARFEADFRIQRQHERYLDLYGSTLTTS